MSREKGRSCSQGFGGTQWEYLVYHRGEGGEDVLHHGYGAEKEVLAVGGWGGGQRGVPLPLKTISQDRNIISI